MSAAVVPTAPGLGPAVIDHLTRQIVSARRLLDLILRQGAAIRERRAEEVVAVLMEIQREMGARAELENERSNVLRHAAVALGTTPLEVTLTALCTVFDEHTAARATEASTELRAILGEISREHALNRALMRQELSFLDHLTRLAGGDRPGYNRDAAGATGARTSLDVHSLDARV